MDNLDPENIPRHVAIIMDGNGRWAEERGQGRVYGHINGVESMRKAIRAAVRRGVKFLTVYAFSTETWGRPKEEVQALMEEMGFLPRSIRRGADALLYFKQSEHIEDFLTKIGAPAAAMDIMTAKVDKEIRNGANRAMNCDMANVNKTLDAAQEQVGAIEKLRRNARWDTLPEKLRQTAALRLEYPELSLVQLAEKCDPPVTKSCMNHRMRKLMEEAKEL